MANNWNYVCSRRSCYASFDASCPQPCLIPSALVHSAELKSLCQFVPCCLSLMQANILFGLPEDAAHLRTAVHAAGFTEDVAAMNLGLDTPVAEKGTSLSGVHLWDPAVCRHKRMAPTCRWAAAARCFSACDLPPPASAGGQRIRLGLARVAYAALSGRVGAVLLDDPLAGVLIGDQLGAAAAAANTNAWLVNHMGRGSGRPRQVWTPRRPASSSSA